MRTEMIINAQSITEQKVDDTKNEVTQKVDKVLVFVKELKDDIIGEVQK